jgi:hypothetical protein
MGHTVSLREMKLNIAYFYRVLGKQQIHLLTDILQNESDLIEPTLRFFFQCYTGPGDADRAVGRPSLRTMYAYASYLLDTFGGQSYLLRRGSRTRMLIM